MTTEEIVRRICAERGYLVVVYARQSGNIARTFQVCMVISDGGSKISEEALSQPFRVTRKTDYKDWLEQMRLTQKITGCQVDYKTPDYDFYRAYTD